MWWLLGFMFIGFYVRFNCVEKQKRKWEQKEKHWKELKLKKE